MQYTKNKDYFGSFWGLYLIGIRTIYDVKYSICELIVAAIIQFILARYTNIIVLNKEIQPNDLVIVLSLIYAARVSESIQSWVFYRIILSERLHISGRISTYVNKLYLTASHSWKSNNTNTAQKESLREIFFAYDNMTHTLTRILQSTISSSVIILVAFQNDTIIGLVIIVGSLIIFKVKKMLNTKLSIIDKQMGDLTNTQQLVMSNQFTNRADTLYMPNFKRLFEKAQYDPVNGLTGLCQVWDNRHILSNHSSTIISIMQSIIMTMLCVYG